MNSETRPDDLSWAALMATAREIAPDLGEEFLKKAYKIELTHQFSRDRAESLLLLERLIEAELGAG